MGLSEVSLCWCQGEVCEAGSGQGRILRWWRLFKGFSDLLFGLVSIRSGGAWCLGWTLPICFCAQSPLLVIAGGFFLCSQRQTRGSSVSLEFKVLVLHGCVASGSSSMALSHRLSCVPGGSVSWSSSIPGSRSSHLIVSS
ncbi:hypothetical protein Bca101_088620 [Brassica carinata]